MKQPRYTLTLTDLSIGDVLALRTAAQTSKYPLTRHMAAVVEKAVETAWLAHVDRRGVNAKVVTRRRAQ